MSARLSGGQHAQVALAAALAKRPELLLLDEPVARLDPLARHEFMAALMAAVADEGLSVIFSSHVVAELERVCDYLVLLGAGQVQVAGPVDDLVAGHRMLVGPADEAALVAERLPVVQRRLAGRQAHLLARTNGGPPAQPPSGWEVHAVGTRGARPRLPARAGRARVPGPSPLDHERRGGSMSAPGGAGRRLGSARRERSFLPGMLWVVWRQHRLALAGTLALFGVLAAFLVAQGIGMHATWNQLGLGRPPTPSAPPGSRALAITFENEYLTLGMYAPRVVMFVPLVVGALVGAPLLARELESGTFRFAWTQGIGRTRWLVTKLVALGLALTLVALAFSLVFSWWYRPFALLSGHQPEVEGLVFAARMLLGLPPASSWAPARAPHRAGDRAHDGALARRRRAHRARPAAAHRGAADRAGRPRRASSRPSGA